MQHPSPYASITELGRGLFANVPPEELNDCSHLYPDRDIETDVQLVYERRTNAHKKPHKMRWAIGWSMPTSPGDSTVMKLLRILPVSQTGMGGFLPGMSFMGPVTLQLSAALSHNHKHQWEVLSLGKTSLRQRAALEAIAWDTPTSNGDRLTYSSEWVTAVLRCAASERIFEEKVVNRIVLSANSAYW
jgi:hypothetical protein